MGCRNRAYSEDEIAVRGPLNDALLFTTMCIVGLPVDVHVKDGSIFSGTFYSASMEEDYGIVLKKAKMTKKGNGMPNVGNGTVIETLVIFSEDLVQVVAKRVLLPGEDLTGNISGAYSGKVAGKSPPFQVSVVEANSTDSGQINSETRTGDVSSHCLSSGRASLSGSDTDGENVNSDGKGFVKTKEAFNCPDSPREVGDDGLHGKTHSNGSESDFLKGQATSEVQDSGINFDAPMPRLTAAENSYEVHTPAEDLNCVDAVSSGASSAMSTVMDLASKSNLSSLPNPPEMVLPRGSSAKKTSKVNLCDNGLAISVACQPNKFLKGEKENRYRFPPSVGKFIWKAAYRFEITKSSFGLWQNLSQWVLLLPRYQPNAREFKLNPRAKTFSPSLPQQRSATPPALQPVPSLAYGPNNYTILPVATPQAEVENGPFVPRSSLPVKFTPYSNVSSGNGSNFVQYPSSIVGYATNRTQPTRYSSQYHPVQAGPTYVHSSSQNVMVGRLGQLVYVQPVSQDMVQNTASFTQVSTGPPLIPHQVHLPKHQGTVGAQPLHLPVAPPPYGLAEQPFTVLSHGPPISQPPFPVIHPNPIPGANGFFGSKFS